ncbi:MAG: amino acid permease, partial [Candidatus Riflebacteria bacterium]|nr:amino acid permease [Candidatus Riflebacteria bacterium]
TGGVYVLIREGWGRLPAFLFGFTELVVIRASSLGAISLTFSEYTLRALGRDPAVEPHATHAHLVAAVAIAVMSGANILGLRYGAFVQNVTSIAKYAGLVGIVGLALGLGLPLTGGHFTPAWPAGSFHLGAFGLALVAVLWAYDGWADLCFVGGEVKDPRGNLPRALVVGTLAIIAIYVLAPWGSS